MFELSASQTASPKKPRSVFCEKKKFIGRIPNLGYSWANTAGILQRKKGNGEI